MGTTEKLNDKVQKDLEHELEVMELNVANLKAEEDEQILLDKAAILTICENYTTVLREFIAIKQVFSGWTIHPANRDKS